MSSIKTIEGGYSFGSANYGIAVSRFNGFIVERSFELPLAVKTMAESENYDAIIALGAVIRGGTAHFEYVAGECVKGISHVGLTLGLPVSFGVLTVDTIEQAIERAGSKAGNKGEEAALTAMEMLSLMRQIKG